MICVKQKKFKKQSDRDGLAAEIQIRPDNKSCQQCDAKKATKYCFVKVEEKINGNTTEQSGNTHRM